MVVLLADMGCRLLGCLLGWCLVGAWLVLPCLSVARFPPLRKAPVEYFLTKLSRVRFSQSCSHFHHPRGKNLPKAVIISFRWICKVIVFFGRYDRY